MASRLNDGRQAGGLAWWTLALVFWASAAACAQTPVGQLIDFDIPAQPLDQALNRYGETAGLSALYPSDLPLGLRSSPVHGRYAPEEALRRLLRGTGLVLAKAATPHGEVFRLTRPVAAQKTGNRAAAGANGAAGYLPRLQAAVMQVLCGDGRTAPGSYGSMFEVAVDETGGAAAVAVISSSGDARRDAALLAGLRQVRTGPPPPASAHVPYLFTLRPAPAGAPSPCLSAAGGAP
ncbi:ferric siderophore receptor [Bordetella ansorpii]|uniref:Ferric siderophore receptor n=1 Tax=Bordetella ansorpii TaxID=288768 RepID=A0A157QA11_9BORD|nr:secretin and TonB N-terminal domain-containing protein [Bordetella ansorpii]SAI42682.1 ferric siderophore receptor [Bordetella ansorpii]SAI74322.1 ferric siderophore receptor [Bordetella ansorpii]